MWVYYSNSELDGVPQKSFVPFYQESTESF